MKRGNLDMEKHMHREHENEDKELRYPRLLANYEKPSEESNPTNICILDV